MSKVTLTQIAELSEVSVATVSRALSQHRSVSDEVRQRVIGIANDLGYRPRRGDHRQVIGLVIPTQKRKSLSAYVSQLLGHMALEISSRDYGMEIVMTDDINLLKKSFLIGAILLTPNPEIEERWSAEFSFPLICINSRSNHGRFRYAVGSNEKQGMQLAVSHLHERGHRNIGLITFGRATDLNNIHRSQFFLEIAEQLGIAESVSSAHITTQQNYFEPVGNILRKGATALICTGEDVGIYVSYVLELFSKQVPDELSLITYEHADISCYCSPPQTTLAQDFEKISTATIDLLETISKEPAKAQDARINYRLIERESVSDAAS
jgi:DNA-binding LacI/PurR family transcriptional regulator